MSFDKIKSIHLASDHAGFAHKEAVRIWLEDSIYKVIDHGDKENQPDDDFPDYISKAAKAVSDYPDDSVAIIFGGSGQGEAMLANRFPNVRAAVYYGGDRELIALAREHNDANILSFGARFVTIEEVKAGILTWLSTPALSDEKYQRRNQKIEAITKQIYKA
jgi:ribose 5-phosphate isomerase B